MRAFFVGCTVSNCPVPWVAFIISFMRSIRVVESIFQSTNQRPLASKRRVITLHLLVSLVVMALAALLVFGFWFPSELWQVAGGLRLFAILAGVDVVCGPFLTMVLYRTTKSRREIGIDLTLVALIQVAALSYGLHTLALARPLAQVFEVDRFRLISYSDIAEGESEKLPPWFKPWSFEPLHTLGLRPLASSSERLDSLNAALQGVDAGQRPHRWQDYALNRAEVLERSKPLVLLRTIHADLPSVVDKAVAKAMLNIQPGETGNADELRWLPLVSRSSLDGVVLLDPESLRIRAYAPLDGFR